jgi:hypothetical protein
MRICNECNIEKDLSEFNPRRGKCKDCRKVIKNNYRLNNMDKHREHSNKYRSNNLEKERERDRIRSKDRKPIGYEKSRENHLKYRYGITISVYNKLFENQNGCCKICNEHQSNLKSPLAVDHNHIDNKIRGLLCMKCNTAIGKFNDDITLLQNTINYLLNE